MTAIRQIYENLPKTIITPVFLKNRRVEVIMLPLDEAAIDKILDALEDGAAAEDLLLT